MGIRGWGWPLGIANPLSNWPIPISLYKSLIHFLKKMAAIFIKANIQYQLLILKYLDVIMSIVISNPQRVQFYPNPQNF